jgi:hypothetical protein
VKGRDNSEIKKWKVSESEKERTREREKEKERERERESEKEREKEREREIKKADERDWFGLQKRTISFLSKR